MIPKNRDVQCGKRNKGKGFKKPTPVTNLMVPTSVISSPGVCGLAAYFCTIYGPNDDSGNYRCSYYCKEAIPMMTTDLLPNPFH